MKRSAWIMAGAIVALGAAAWIVLQRPGETSVDAGSEAMLAAYDSAAVDRLVITGPRGTVTLEQQAGRWMVKEPLEYPADQTAVTAAVGKGRSLALTGLVSSNPEKQSLFQLDSTGTLVRVFEHGTEKAAFRIGKPSSSYQETYVRAEGSNDVYVAREMLTSVFSRGVKDWRDKAVLGVSTRTLTSIAYRYGDTTFVLALRDSVWVLDGTPAAQPAVPPLLNALANLQCDEFVDTPVTAPPKLSATIATNDVEIRFHQLPGSTTYLVQNSGSGRWFEIQQWKAEQVLKRKIDLLPPR